MVSVEQIDKIITNIISNVSTKCGHTIAEMHSQLDNISYNDQLNDLKEKGYLNPLEEKDYIKKLERLKVLDKYFDEHGTDDLMGAEVTMFQEREDLVEELFKYGRRLIEGLKYNELPMIDKDKYVSDEQWGGRRGHNFEWSHEQGEMEKAQINAQVKSLNFNTENILTEDGMRYNVDTFEGKSALAMDNYFNGDSQHINFTISHEGYVKALNNEQRKQMESIDNLMNKSPGLLQDTILYRAGYFDIHLKEGDSFSFKGYTSTTFQEETTGVYKNSDGYDGDMTYVIHAPKGTKGICGSDKTFHNNNWEHEYVLPRNTKCTVLSIDYDNMVCEVVIE